MAPRERPGRSTRKTGRPGRSEPRRPDRHDRHVDRPPRGESKSPQRDIREQTSRRGRRRQGASLGVRGDLLYGRNAVIESLRARRRSGRRLFLADGVREDERVEQLIELAGAEGVQTERVPRQMLDDLTDGGNHQGVALETAAYPYVALEDIIEREGTVLVLDHLNDPQNFGTLVRAGDAAAIAGIVIPTDRSVRVTPAVVNASAGAVEHLPVAQVTNLGRALEKLEKNGRWLIGLDDGEDAQNLFTTDLPTPCAVVVGAEGPGLTRTVRQRCQVIVSIPMRGAVASLNAATAGSILLFDIARRTIGERIDTNGSDLG